MSQETIDLLREDRKNHVELNPSSETFQVIGGSSFLGVFDRNVIKANKDQGNVKQQRLRAVIMVASIPSGLVQGQSIIKRENGEEYTFFKPILDDEGIGLLWLY